MRSRESAIEKEAGNILLLLSRSRSSLAVWSPLFLFQIPVKPANHPPMARPFVGSLASPQFDASRRETRSVTLSSNLIQHEMLRSCNRVTRQGWAVGPRNMAFVPTEKIQYLPIVRQQNVYANNDDGWMRDVLTTAELTGRHVEKSGI